MTNKINYKTGMFLEDLRKTYNLTQQELAENLGVTKVSISNWENGKSISLDALKDLAAFYGITVQEILDGKLTDQSAKSFVEYNYGIEKYALNGKITDFNYLDVYQYFSQVYTMQNRFKELIESYFYNDFDELELEEFNFIKNYFIIDTSAYYNLKKVCPELEDITMKSNSDIKMNVLKELKKAYKSSYKDYLWEACKIFNRIYDLRINEIIYYENEELFSLLLKLLSRPERDSILTGNLDKDVFEQNNPLSAYTSPVVRPKSEHDIEGSSFMKMMLNNNCRCLYKNYYFHLGDFAQLDYEDISMLEGDIKEDLVFHKNYYVSDSHRSFSRFNDKSPFTSYVWKTLSFDEYEALVDHKRTKYLQALVNYKDKEPLKYYEALKEFCNFE